MFGMRSESGSAAANFDGLGKLVDAARKTGGGPCALAIGQLGFCRRTVDHAQAARRFVAYGRAALEAV